MKILFERHAKEVMVTVLILGLFIVASYFSQRYFDVLTELLGEHDVFGMFLYILGASVATIIAPLSFLPILPIAVMMWGSVMAAILSIIAWTIGAAVAFLLAKRYGRPLVRHFVGERRMAYFSDFLPKKYLFIAVVFLRMALPVDLLSYALGLLGVMKFWPYLWATIIGITPFAFVFSYLAEFDIRYQVGALVIGVTFIALSFPYMKCKYTEMFLQNIDS